MTKKDAAKKAVIEIHHKKQGLLEEQIQQQKLLLKKLETAETTTEKESIRSLMKQFDTTIVMLKDSLRLTPPIKSSSTTAAPVTSLKPSQTIKISQQDVLKQRAQTLQKQLETLRAKTSADMVTYIKILKYYHNEIVFF
jgi:tRNA(Phe) wybutosine-synthesizing methylase Tyw3